MRAYTALGDVSGVTPRVPFSASLVHMIISVLDGFVQVCVTGATYRLAPGCFGLFLAMSSRTCVIFPPPSGDKLRALPVGKPKLAAAEVAPERSTHVGARAIHTHTYARARVRT